MGSCCTKEDTTTVSSDTTKNPLKNNEHSSSSSSSLSLPPQQKQFTKDDILFINYNDLVKFTQLPRYPDNANICVDVNTIDRSNSMLVYVSHNWLRSGSNASGWMTKQHPDNLKHDKHQLIVKGIEKLKLLAPGMKDCYVWIDYCCINQNVDPALELIQLDKIITACDVLLTPIVDDEWDKWQFPRIINNWYTQYKAKSWNDGEHAFLNRSWCRLEMMYSANIPLHEDAKAREDKFASGIHHAIKSHRRPHYIFGTKELNDGIAPIGLPPFSTAFPQEYDPLLNSFVTNSADLIKIEELMTSLKSFLEKITSKPKVGYCGERNFKGQRHGKGIELFQNGNKFDGQWVDGKMQSGLLTFTNGNIYEGDFMDNQFYGTGKLTYTNGNIYEGQWKIQQEGQGRLIFKNGNIFEGIFENGKYNKGKLTYAKTGDVYEGEFDVQGRLNGQGKFLYEKGDVYEGTFKDDKIHGTGRYQFKNGDDYNGDWKDGKIHGTGHFQYKNGDDYNGDWIDNKKCGFGKFTYSNKDIYVGEFKDDQKTGQGNDVYAGGDNYVGGYLNNLKHGYGVYTYADGKIIKGTFDHGEFSHM